MADDWMVWLGVSGGALAFILSSWFTGPNAARVLDLAAGLLLGVLLTMWMLGGHISAFRWQLGAMGEQDTAQEIEKLGPGWHCEHDLVHSHGNWDHVVVGPPGIFVLDSKLIHGRAVVEGDELRSGRMRFSGRGVRGAAVAVKKLLDVDLGRSAGWVQGVVVVWGDFAQARHEHDRVMYVRGDELVQWLTGLEQKIGEPELAARVTAVRRLRERLSADA